MDYKHADVTLINYLRVTNKLLWAIRDYSRDTHVIKLGPMGGMEPLILILKKGGWILNIKDAKKVFYILVKLAVCTTQLKLWTRTLCGSGLVSGI